MNINRCLPVIRATLPLKFPKPEAMMFNDRQSESTVYRTFGLFTANYSVISVIDHGNARAWTLLASYTGAWGQDLPPPPPFHPKYLDPWTLLIWYLGVGEWRGGGGSVGRAVTCGYRYCTVYNVTEKCSEHKNFKAWYFSTLNIV